MKPTYEDLLKIVRELQEENGEIRRENKELGDHLERVENELRKYKNENTPPSANKHLKGNTQGLHAKGGKRGSAIWP